jgi:nucleoside-diphosphate-sugar epimerase
MTRTLVTGGLGFIGSGLVRRLLERGDEVRVLDNRARGSMRRLSDVAEAFELLNADIRDAEAVRRAVAGTDRVIHLAYVNGTQWFYREPELVLDVGIRGILNIVGACRSEAVGDLIVASSSEVYQTPDQIPTDEAVPLTVPDVLNPRYSYGGGKIASELIVVNYGRTDFDRVSIVRPHNVYGLDMGWDHVIPQLTLRALEAVRHSPTGVVSFQVQGDGFQTRAFMHIDDCVRAIETVLDKGSHLTIYNIGNPEEVPITAIVDGVFSRLGRSWQLQPGPLPVGSPQRRCPEISRLKALGFVPMVPLQVGLPGVVDWYLSNAHLRNDT